MITMDARSRWQSKSPSSRPVLPSNVVNNVVMDLILTSSAGLWTGALAADHLGPSSGVIATALIRGATGGPAGVASEIGAAGSSVGEGAPTSRRSRREVGPGGGGARTDGGRLHPAIAFRAAVPSGWPAARSRPACR